MKFRAIFLLFLFYILANSSLHSQVLNSETTNDFFFDAVVFRSDSLNLGRVDVFILVPYETLSFIRKDKIFAASYEIDIQVNDKNGKRIEGRHENRILREEDYSVTLGSSGKFDYKQIILNLPTGEYKIAVQITDKFNRKSFERIRSVSIINFPEFNFSLSGILLLSSIEENNGRYKITPHISDNIGILESGYFAFFESYGIIPSGNSVDFIWEILDSKNEVIAFSNRIRKYIDKNKNQHFINIPVVKEMTNGTYLLRISAMEPDTSNDLSNRKILAVSQRSLNFTRTIAGNILNDIELAIRQLRYAAFQNEIDYINEAPSIFDKQKRFEAFWKKQDPSPGTDRNEAFIEYYSRIAYADRTFKSYQDGWMTDKGMVYIIFGNPNASDKQVSGTDERIYERWIYNDNREFIFLDNSGFGDFRLIRPMSVTEKYKYKR